MTKIPLMKIEQLHYSTIKVRSSSKTMRITFYHVDTVMTTTTIFYHELIYVAFKTRNPRWSHVTKQ